MMPRRVQRGVRRTHRQPCPSHTNSNHNQSIFVPNASARPAPAPALASASAPRLPQILSVCPPPFVSSSLSFLPHSFFFFFFFVFRFTICLFPTPSSLLRSLQSSFCALNESGQTLRILSDAPDTMDEACANPLGGMTRRTPDVTALANCNSDSARNRNNKQLSKKPNHSNQQLQQSIRELSTLNARGRGMLAQIEESHDRARGRDLKGGFQCIAYLSSVVCFTQSHTVHTESL